MATEAASYEQRRMQRLEENKKRMEQLNLHNLSQALKPSTNKSSKAKADSGVAAPVRRSTRMVDKPTPNYNQNTVGGGRLYAIKRAEELESRLGSEFPTFIKPLSYSHVSGGLMTHLIDYEGMLTLVDEDGVECQTKYHLRYNGLGSGWRGFFTNHDLVDVLYPCFPARRTSNL